MFWVRGFRVRSYSMRAEGTRLGHLGEVRYLGLG